MYSYKLWWLEFTFKIYNNIIESKVKSTFKEIDLFIKENNLFLVNSYIFTCYTNNQYIKKFCDSHQNNLIYSRDDNKFNIQLLFVKYNNNFEIIKYNNNEIWINFDTDYANILFLNWVTYNDKDFKLQTEHAYETLFTKYKELWYKNENFIKAWNFIEDVLINYWDFNKIRNNFFEVNWITWMYPAWTWIDCSLPWNIKHSSSYFLLKSKNKNISIKTLNSELQCEAYEYWPKFSRAKLISSKIDNNNILFISWTAAVNNRWESIFIDDIEENIKYTFKSFENLLNQAWMTFDNLVSSFIYIKDKKFESTFLKVYKDNNFIFPYIYNFCDVCRDDFLFEIEWIAVK